MRAFDEENCHTSLPTALSELSCRAMSLSGTFSDQVVAEFLEVIKMLNLLETEHQIELSAMTRQQ
jgi:hypothetical protein